MTGYEETIRRLGEKSSEILLQLWAAVEAGELPVSDFPEVAAQVLAVANNHGRSAAELALNGYMTAATGEVTVPAPFAVVDDTPRLTTAMATIAASQADTVMQLGRIGLAEPLEAAARRFSDGIARSPRATGWVRQMEPDACQLCRWWWREGRVWPKEHPFQTHKGCTCNPLPTVAEGIESTMYTRKLERARVAQENTEKYNPERIAS